MKYQLQFKFRNVFVLFILLGIVAFGCRTPEKIKAQNLEENPVSLREYSAQSVLWQQLSAEYRALVYQAFNLAEFRLDEFLSNNQPGDKSFAIITDIDETVLDNSPFNAKLIELDEEYSKENWTEWVKLENATAIPGSLAFLSHTASKGVEVFYVSNRLTTHTKETINNLKKFGFPFADEKHLLLKEESSGKEPRRQQVLGAYEVILLLGDNLSDFSDAFDKQKTKRRNDLVDSLRLQFGDKFIVFPNPMYGDWETKGINEGNYEWTPAQKDSIRKAKLISY